MKLVECHLILTKLRKNNPFLIKLSKGDVMNEKALKALIGSITKWDLIAQGVICEDDMECPLCELFFNKRRHVPCMGCPVTIDHIDRQICSGTPYHSMSLTGSLTISQDIKKFPHDKPKLHEIENEIEFLISLLPEGSEEAEAYILK